jgi:hypothetical protein
MVEGKSKPLKPGGQPNRRRLKFHEVLPSRQNEAGSVSWYDATEEIQKPSLARCRLRGLANARPDEQIPIARVDNQVTTFHKRGGRIYHLCARQSTEADRFIRLLACKDDCRERMIDPLMKDCWGETLARIAGDKLQEVSAVNPAAHGISIGGLKLPYAPSAVRHSFVIGAPTSSSVVS